MLCPYPLYRFSLIRTCMMLNFVGAGSPTIIAHNLQSHKPAPAHTENCCNSQQSTVNHDLIECHRFYKI